MRTRWIVGALLAIAAGLASAPAQPAFQFDVVYSCSSGRSKLKVLSCAGNSDAHSCDVQYLDNTAAQGLGARIAAPRKQVEELLATCAIQRPPAKTETAPAQSQPRPAPQSQREPPAAAQPPQAARKQQPVPSAPAPPRQPDNLLHVGDVAEARFMNAGQWQKLRIMDIQGNRALVQFFSSGAQGWTDEIRRVAPPKPAQTAASPAAKTPGTPCGAKLEGRWSGTSTPLTIEFRSGKARISAMVLGEEVADCFISGDQIILRKAGEREDMILRLNDDGTMDTPFGEIRKKGK
jgi:hypothetical protein